MSIGRHTPLLSDNMILRAVSFDAALLIHLADAITALSNDRMWVEVDDTVEDVVTACKDVVESWYSNMLIGSVFPWLINPPFGWLLLDGSTYAISDYPELSDLLPGHLISGANFTLPDASDCFPFCVQDQDIGSQVAGSNILNLTIAQLPSHTHTYTPPTLTISAETPVVPIPTAGIGAPIPTGATGSGDDIDKRPKMFGLLYAVYAGRE